MKFTIKDKNLDVQPATLRQIAKLEKNVGNVSKMTEDAPFETMVSMLKEILSYQPQEDVDIDWLLDNTNMGDVQIINDIIGHFLGVSAQEEK
jgi:hypothetical protein|tara:strand:+ start:657 stop:932 length:276 start_codon:yes stop_codon:yes gene_type:complete